MGRAWLLAVASGLAGVCLAGCSGGPGHATRSENVAPPDFALVVTVTPFRTADGNPPHLRAAQHVVEADGTFRAAVGPGTHADLLPPVTARLDPVELDRLWRLVRPLDVREPEASARRGPDVRVELAVTASHRTRRGEVRADAAEPLLRRLADLRGDGESRPAAMRPDSPPAEP